MSLQSSPPTAGAETWASPAQLKPRVASDIKGVNIFGTITVTAGAIANGRCVDLTLTVPGAEPEQAVLLSLRAPAEVGMVFMGVRVPADDQVLAKVCNFTGGASPGVDHLPIRLLTFG